MKTFIMLVFVASWLAGCTSTQQWLESKPESFRKGYKAGCENGRARASNSLIEKTDNTPAYKHDEQYREGWDEGYSDCQLDKKTDILMQRPGILP